MYTPRVRGGGRGRVRAISCGRAGERAGERLGERAGLRRCCTTGGAVGTDVDAEREDVTASGQHRGRPTPAADTGGRIRTDRRHRPPRPQDGRQQAKQANPHPSTPNPPSEAGRGQEKGCQSNALERLNSSDATAPERPIFVKNKS